MYKNTKLFAVGLITTGSLLASSNYVAQAETIDTQNPKDNIDIAEPAMIDPGGGGLIAPEAGHYYYGSSTGSVSVETQNRNAAVNSLAVYAVSGALAGMNVPVGAVTSALNGAGDIMTLITGGSATENLAVSQYTYFANDPGPNYIGYTILRVHNPNTGAYLYSQKITLRTT